MQLIDNFHAFSDRFSRPVHIVQAILVLGAFIVGCALVADTTMVKSRSTTMILVYSIKSAVFLLYQYLTTHTDRFRRFASLKANFFLDLLDCLLWFTSFILMCMGGSRCHSTSCALLGIGGTLSLLLCAMFFITAFGINWPKWRASKKVVQMEQV